MRDTIAAIATAAGAGGVGIVRLSGPDAIAIAERVIGRSLDDRRVIHAVATDAAGARIDDVLAFALRGPRSFTGEDVAELQGHGGAVNLGQLLRAVLDRGARAAEPGEFTRRAFESGRLDLARAEGLIAVIDAGSERAWRQAQAQLAGALGAAIRAVDARITRALAEIEGAIDFPEDDLEVRGQAWLGDELAAARAACDELARTYGTAQIARDGIEVALVGAVNVGKSSLLNALVGRERALVDAAPGTTRDYVEATCEWDGYAVTLIDTAGARPSADAVEQRGIALGEQRAEAADVVIVVDDGSGGGGGGDAGRYGPRALRVRSKADLGGAAGAGAGAGDAVIATSAVTGQGVAELRRAIVDRALGVPADAATGAVVTTERQRAALSEAVRRMDATIEALRADVPLEMVALELRSAHAALGNVLGAEVGEDVIDEVFARFCIGK